MRLKQQVQEDERGGMFMKEKGIRCLPWIVLSVFMLFMLPMVDYVCADVSVDHVKELMDEGWALEGKMHVDLANLDKAIAVHEEALSLAPGNEEAMWRLGEVIFKKSEETRDEKKRKAMLERTVALSEQALAVNPKSVGGLYWAGTAYARLADMSHLFSAAKQIKQSKAYLHQAIHTDPNHRLSILSGVILAKIYSESPWPLKDMDKASGLALWSVGKDPNLTFASLTLGKINLETGQKDAARKLLQRCLDTKHPTYIWDAVLYDWPEAKKVLAGIK